MLDIDIPTFIFVVINLIVLYIAMKKLLFKPVTKFMEKRKKSISDSMENAKKEMAEALELKQKYNEILKDARDEAENIINTARIKAEAEYDNIVNKATVKAEVIIVSAEERIEKERQKVLAGIKSEIAGLALLAASKVVETNMDTEKNRKLVEKFIDEAGKVKKLGDERQNILNITIYSAIEISQQEIDKINDIYKSRYNAMEIKSKVVIDKKLLGGIKVKINNHIEDASSVSRLQSLKELFSN